MLHNQTSLHLFYHLLLIGNSAHVILAASLTKRALVRTPSTLITHMSQMWQPIHNSKHVLLMDTKVCGLNAKKQSK